MSAVSTRRVFLKQYLGISTFLSLAPAVPALLGRAAFGAFPREDRDTILVVLQLAGGNDGLNTVVPYADDEYGRARYTLRLTANEVLKIDSLLGWHPRMKGFARLFAEGHLAVIQGVGYPNPHQGHFESMRIWQTARLEEASSCRTGWLGQAIDSVYRPEHAQVPALFVGQIERPFALSARRAIVPWIDSLRQCVMSSMPGADAASHRNWLTELAAAERSARLNPMLQFVQQSTLAARATSRRIEAAAETLGPTRTPDYPPFHLARMLRTIAQLIRADLPIRIYFTELGGPEPGGFDNHAGQRDNHAALLEQLSESVTAFADDLRLANLLDRVLLMTFSEFGRTVRENGRRGTDHGSAAPMFLVGGRVRGGLIGAHPNLTELENGGQRFHTDFRRVYATVLERWLGFDSQLALGARFDPLDVLTT